MKKRQKNEIEMSTHSTSTREREKKNTNETSQRKDVKSQQIFQGRNVILYWFYAALVHTKQAHKILYCVECKKDFNDAFLWLSIFFHFSCRLSFALSLRFYFVCFIFMHLYSHVCDNKNRK